MILSEEVIQTIQRKGAIDWNKLEGMLQESSKNCSKFCLLVSRMGYMDLSSLGSVVADSLKKTYVDLRTTLFQPEVLAKVDRDIALRYKAIPLYVFGQACVVAMADPNDLETIIALEKILGTPVDPVFSFEDEIEAAIKVNFESPDKVAVLANKVDVEALLRLEDSKLVELKPIVSISESLILLALKERVTDIHIEPKRKDCIIRFRIDGALANRLRLPAELARPLLARFKVMAGLDIAESRRPQDGRISFPTALKHIDIRVSTLPVVHGEKAVLRILGSLAEDVPLNLEKLGFAQHVLEPLRAMLEEPNGMILITGPTGSGKSTSMYACLNYIDSPDSNISTIEDPIEYEIQALNQSAVDVKAGRTFQLLLRSLLRQDPDVIFVGEIRDTETARIAAQAALTGHLVLSTLHTNNALQALTRLIDMGVEAHLAAPALLGVVSQRLVRRLCLNCRKPRSPQPEMLRKYFHWEEGTELPQLHASSGCKECGGTGFRGRIGIHEIFVLTHQVRELAAANRSAAEIRALAYRTGFKDMRYDGFRKAFQGLTTIEEVVRVTSTEC